MTGATVRPLGMPLAAALPVITSWIEQRAWTLPTLLFTIVLSATVAYRAFKAIPPRSDNGAAASLLIAVALVSTITSCNSLFLVKDAFRTAPYEIPALLLIGVVVTAPALLLIWLGATLCVAFRSGGWWGAFGALLVVGGLGLLLFLYGSLSGGGSLFR